MIEGGAGDHDAAGLGQALQPRRDVDAVAVNVVALDDDVAEVDADPELGCAGPRPDRHCAGHVSLDLDRALHGVDYAGELDQRAIAHQLDDASVVLTISGSMNSRRSALRRACVPCFVGRHHSAVADDVGSQDRRQLALDAFGLQKKLPLAAHHRSIPWQRKSG